MDLQSLEPGKHRISTHLYVERLTNTGKNRGLKIDKKIETVPDNLNNYFDKNVAGTKTALDNSANNCYSHKKFKYTDKELILLNLLYHDKYKSNTLIEFNNHYIDRSLRARMVADFLQSYTSVPLMTRKLTRQQIKVNSLQFPIHPKHAFVGDNNLDSEALQRDDSTDDQYKSKETWSTDTFTSSNDDGPVKKEKYSHLSIHNVSNLLKRLYKHVKNSPDLVKTLLPTSGEVEVLKNGKTIKGSIPDEVRKLVIEDSENGSYFLCKCIEKSFDLLNQHLNEGPEYTCCYPTIPSGFYGGDYTDIFGFIILIWAYDILKQKNTSIKERFILNAYKAVSDAKKAGAILKQKKSSPFYMDSFNDGDPRITEAIEKYKKKLQTKSGIKAVYGINDYYTQSARAKENSDSILDDYDRLERERQRHTELYDVQESLEKELSDAMSNSKYVNEKHIKNHVFIHPTVGRKIILYTDVNHFKHHLGDSILSGIGTLMQLDIVPDNLFNCLKLCSVVSGGVFDLKYDSKHQQLSFKNNKKKALLLNYSDSEFVKFAHIIDVRHLTTTPQNMEILKINLEAFSQYDIGNRKSLINPNNNKYAEHIDIGDISIYCKQTYGEYEISKRAHLINTSSDVTTCVKYEQKVFNGRSGENELFKFKAFITSMLSGGDRSTSINKLMMAENELTEIKGLTGDKLYFRYMRKIPSLSEDLIRDSVSFDLLKTRYIYCKNVSFVNLKLGLNGERFYKEGLPSSTSDGMIYIRTIPYMIEDRHEGKNALPLPITTTRDLERAIRILSTSDVEIVKPADDVENLAKEGLKARINSYAPSRSSEMNQLKKRAAEHSYPLHIIEMVRKMNVIHKKRNKGAPIPPNVQSALLKKFKHLTKKEAFDFVNDNVNDIATGRYNAIMKKTGSGMRDQVNETVQNSENSEFNQMEDDDYSEYDNMLTENV